MTGVLLGLRFLWELGLLTAVGLLGAAAVDGPVAGALAAAALVVVVAVGWGWFLAPRRRVDLPVAVRVIVELGLYLGAGYGLAVVGRAAAGVVLVVGELVLLTALAALGHPPGTTPVSGAAPPRSS